jgi:hypothetical protein
MSTLTYNEVNNFLFDDFKKHQFLSDVNHEMSEQDIDMVSGGFNALDGFTWGGAIGTTVGTALTGSSIGAANGGFLGASLGFVGGLGWSAGTYLNDNVINPWLWD